MEQGSGFEVLDPWNDAGCVAVQLDLGREQVRHQRGNAYIFSGLGNKTAHYGKIEDAVDSSPEDKLHEKLE